LWTVTYVSKSSENFTKNLKKLLQGTAWSQAALARKLGVAPTMISRWASGEHVPSLEWIEEIAGAFGLSASELLEVKEPKPRVVQPDPIQMLKMLEREILSLQAGDASQRSKIEDLEEELKQFRGEAPVLTARAPLGKVERILKEQADEIAALKLENAGLKKAAPAPLPTTAAALVAAITAAANDEAKLALVAGSVSAILGLDFSLKGIEQPKRASDRKRRN
jgi:transcriptional regulator with XRE-family HTH domain